MSSVLKRTPAEGKIEANIWGGFGKSRFFLRHLKAMEVDGTKPDFRWNNFTYTIDLDYCSKFNKNKLPILDYERNHSIPIRLGVKKDELPEKDSSKVFDEIFNLGILKAILSAATRLKADNPIWLPILAGIGIGFVLGLVSVHFGIIGGTVTTTGTGSGSGIGGH